MSARTATRRTLRSAAATAVVAAVAGTVLMPLSAYAAPAEDNHHALKITMGAPVPSGPLTRGGATETFELTATNTTDKPSSFHPWILGTPTGSKPLEKADVIFKVEGVTAPATDSFIGQQDGEWQGMFHPAGKSGEGFEIPAGAKLTWKVTIGLTKSYPSIDGDFALRATSYQGEVAQGGDATLVFKAEQTVKTPTLETWFDQINPCQDKTPEYQCREMDLRYRATGDGEFGTALATYLENQVKGGAPEDADLRYQLQVDGQWKDLSQKDGYRLPDIAKGFGKASGERKVHLRVKVGPNAKLAKETTAILYAPVRPADDNTFAFATAEARFQIAPATATTSPSPTPSKSATTQPSTSPSPSASSSATAVAAATTNTKATGASGTLAQTGADTNTGLYSGLAAVLVALGGGAAWLGARRRRATRA
ncbi:LPXTG cell wall anchor domain-containing protein [Streptomyces katrae]|uniref:LPXTG cell wall anchor domain-containing protein n=1 Tax=Streptomyces katrae TaxID=68223 RepID=UPI0004BF295B|nr:LPXTG cell wall anchor domain-containing protein [Streptomyces katrae]